MISKLRLFLALYIAVVSFTESNQLKQGDTVDIPGPDNSYKTANFWEKNNENEIAEVKRIVSRNWRAKNVVLFIGDGYGLSEMVAARIFQGQKSNASKIGELNRLKMEELLPHVALSRTFSTDYQVPDSAATAFAILSGIKTNSATLGFSGGSVSKGQCGSGVNPLPTIADHVKKLGKRVGVVTTARVTHATPAALYAKTEDRDWEGNSPDGCKDIAIQLMEQQKTGLIDVILGGGLKNFMPKDQKTHFNGTSERNDSRNLVATWENDGGKVVYDIDELTNVEANDLPVLGLFADSHMGYDALRRSSSKEPTLQSMTTKAIKLLVENNEDGFFLLVEGARIDHGQHANKPYLTLTEADAFDQTIKAVVDRVNLEETLVIVTADHSHSFSISGYPTLNNPILGTNHMNQSTLTYGSGPNSQDPSSKHPNNINEHQPEYKYPSALNGSQGSHGGEDVLIFADGPMAHMFRGVRMQTYIGAIMQYATCSGKYEDSCPIVRKGDIRSESLKSTNKGNQIKSHFAMLVAFLLFSF